MSDFVNPFALNASEYKRDIDVLKNAIEDTAIYLHTTTGKPLDACKSYIKQQLQPGGRFAFKDRKITYLSKNDVGDREECTTTLSRYFSDVRKNEEILAPTGTTYLPAKVKRSKLSDYQKENVRMRGVAKKEMFKAQNEKNYALADVKNGEQSNAKTANNSISGMHLSPSTPLYNPTAHSSLTSTCRITSGYGNANNEKFLSGNRHYFHHEIVLANIVVLANNTDLNAIADVIKKYNLVIPTVEDTINCVEHSTQLYWTFPDFKQNKHFKKIIHLLECLTPMQRAAFMYVGDAYHLMKLNPEFMRTFLGKLSKRVVDRSRSYEFKEAYGAPDSYRNLAAQLCPHEMTDIGQDYAKITPENLQVFVPTCLNVRDTLDGYRDVIKAFWVTPNVPASVSWFPNSIRRSALVSDTDSTIFTVQDWVIWYCGEISFELEAMQIAATVIALTSESITHVLALMSVNIGVEEKNTFLIAMKNEFKFDVLVPTRIGKHYYAGISCQEGNIKSELEMEIKGVGLKSSSAPVEINSDASKMMKDIIKDFIENKGKVSLYKYVGHVALVEQSIMDSLAKSETTYLRSGNLKDAASYSNPDPLKTPYSQHLMWNEVFGPKYGMMEEPPYPIYKTSMVMVKPREMKIWLDEIKDKALADRMRAYLVRSGKKQIGTFNVPEQVLQSYGIPAEIVQGLNKRKIVTDICRIYYLVLETLRVYLYEKKIQRLAMDVFPQAFEAAVLERMQAGEDTPLLQTEDGDELVSKEEEDEEDEL